MYDKIKEANESIVATDIKGKYYAEVNQRIKAFRMVYPSGSITSEIISLVDGVVTIKATVKNEEGVVIGSGYAQEKENSSFINKYSFVENCETSAVGRALGMCGFGIDASVATYEEVKNVLDREEIEEKVSKEQLKIINSFDKKLKEWIKKRFEVSSLNELSAEAATWIISKVKEKENGTN